MRVMVVMPMSQASHILKIAKKIKRCQNKSAPLSSRLPFARIRARDTLETRLRISADVDDLMHERA
jgi:hypothetical protein